MVKRIPMLGLVIAVILAGCVADAEETPTVDWWVEYVSVVAVTGEALPAVWAEVSAQTDGVVVEVLVEPGDEVAAGDPVVLLDLVDAELAVGQAEVALEAAQAELALLEAQPRAEWVAQAEALLQAAEATLGLAAAQRDQLKAGALEVEIALAEADVAMAQADEIAAREAHRETMKCYSLPGGGQDEICPLLGPVEEQARQALDTATEALEAAQARLAALRTGAEDRVRAAEAAASAAGADRDAAQADLDLVKAGAMSEEIAAAAASASRAQAALDEARAALERTEVRAPLAGTVGLVNVREGEVAVAGQHLFAVGDLGTLRVETTDLGEIEVARVRIGHKATITFDVVPEQVFHGSVTRISPMAEPGAGGVNYTVVIELDEGEIDPAIQWGMTAFVDIEVGS